MKYRSGDAKIKFLGCSSCDLFNYSIISGLTAIIQGEDRADRALFSTEDLICVVCGVANSAIAKYIILDNFNLPDVYIR